MTDFDKDKAFARYAELQARLITRQWPIGTPEVALYEFGCTDDEIELVELQLNAQLHGFYLSTDEADYNDDGHTRAITWRHHIKEEVLDGYAEELSESLNKKREARNTLERLKQQYGKRQSED